MLSAKKKRDLKPSAWGMVPAPVPGREKKSTDTKKKKREKERSCSYHLSANFREELTEVLCIRVSKLHFGGVQRVPAAIPVCRNHWGTMSAWLVLFVFFFSKSKQGIQIHDSGRESKHPQTLDGENYTFALQDTCAGFQLGYLPNAGSQEKSQNDILEKTFLVVWKAFHHQGPCLIWWGVYARGSLTSRITYKNLTQALL